MKSFPICLWGALVMAVFLGCRSQPRSDRSFDEIAALVDGMSGAQVIAALGEPDSRQPIFLHDERWIWWRYTFLDGSDYAPEMRGQLVHLEITFRGPGESTSQTTSPGSWRVASPYGVRYRIAEEKRRAALASGRQRAR